MAASYQKNAEGQTGGIRFETGTITYDSDATVEVYTGLSKILASHFVEVVSGGSADLPSIDETFAAGGIAVPSSGAITIDTAGSSSRKFIYTLWGR